MLSCERARLARLIVRSHPTHVLRNERSQRTRTTVEGATGHVREAAWCHPTDRTFSPTRFQIHGDLYLLMRFTICSSFLTLMVPRDGSYCPSTAQCTLATSTRNLTKISRLPLTSNPRGLVTVLWRSWQTNIVMPSFVAPQHPRHAPSPPPATKAQGTCFGSTWQICGHQPTLFLRRPPHCTFIARPFTSTASFLTADGFVPSTLSTFANAEHHLDRIRRTLDHVCHRVLLGSDTAVVFRLGK